MPDPSRNLSALSPDVDACAVVATSTGWPPSVDAPSPLCWTAAIMVGLRATLLDPGWGIDPLSTRLIEATLTATPVPAEPAAVQVRSAVRQVVDLGELAGLRITIGVLDAAGAVVADAQLTVGAHGRGLTGATRPPAPAAAPSARGEATWSAELGVAADAVVRFADWCGDDTAFHHDDAAAEAAGLPGPTAPGLFVLGLLASAAARATGGPIGAVGARFVRPVLVGAPLRASAFAVTDDGRLALAAESSDGPVVRRAWARPAQPAPS